MIALATSGVHLEELDRDYDHILRKTIGEIEDLTGLPLRHDIGLSRIRVFVASPNMVTSYHFDHETNFLFQIRGEKDVPVDELLRRIETAGAWIQLSHVQEDPDYAALLDACMDEIVALSGRDLSQVMTLRNSIIFINSPNRISTYHIDRECSWLYQIQGRKTISIFDPKDRDVLPEWEIEKFWEADNNAATYRPQYQSRATVIELLPGQGVHIPVGAPHWVQNGPEVSVSLNINFHYLDAITADVYRANYWLRRLGLNPTPLRVSAFKDTNKRSVYGTANRTVLHPARAARRAIRAMKHPTRKTWAVCGGRPFSGRPKHPPVQRRHHRRTNRVLRHFQGIG